MIRTLITEMYGGKIDSDSDWRVLRSLVESCMTPAAYEDHFQLVPADAQSSGRGLELPSSTGWAVFMQWVNELPEREPPAFLGLPANAEKLLLVGQANEMVKDLSTVMGMLEEGERIMAEAEGEAEGQN